MDRQKVVNKEIEGVGFSFYSQEEVRAISVKHITNPILLDALERPVPGGLYDGALGPLDQNGSCDTCGEVALQCPGHFGHIDLVLPVYNPLVFRQLVKILRFVCLFCHRFKMKESRVQNFAEQLEELYKGQKCDDIDHLIAKEDLREHHGQRVISDQNESMGHHEKRFSISTMLNSVRQVLKKFMDEMPRSKCENCEANAPAIRNEGVGKIFQMPLQKSKLTANCMRGLKFTIEDLIRTTSVVDNREEEREVVQNGEKLGGMHRNLIIKGLDITDTGTHGQLRYLTTYEVKARMKRLWEKEERMCSLIWNIQKVSGRVGYSGPSGWSDFFLDALLVPPNRFRPPNKLQGVIMEHPMNVLYTQIIQANMNLANVLCGNTMKKSDSSSMLNSAQAAGLWLSLQNCVNSLIDSSTGKKSDQSGIRQLLEKKDGLFRMNLMGKRVNYSCRSVISPDPYIAVNEIGIPPYFATRLSYPEKATHWNIDRLRAAVINGSSVYPGATHVQDETGVMVALSNISRAQRTALSKTLLSTPRSTANSAATSFGASNDSIKVTGKIVYRHLRDGDALLVNRQPTLHKPSLMGHIARVLKGEKTLRLHYANCSTYNADFDGDEMNVHFPQDEIGRAEAYYIVNANQQYVVPTNGDPIRGLIQDHIIGATLLTKKDTFLTKEEYQELVYSACISSAPASFAKGQRGQAKVGMIEHDRYIATVPPAVWKPKQLWTGKQVITTVLNYVSNGRPAYTVKNIGKVSGEYWGRTSGETKLRIHQNELLHGVIDKAQFGKYGLVHAFKEFYGADAAGQLLSILSRLFTSYLQMFGFTCGMADLLLVPQAERKRQKVLAATQKAGLEVHKRFIGAEDRDLEPGSEELKLEIEHAIQRQGESASSYLDRMMSSSMNIITSEVNTSLFPSGLLKPFPHNCLSLMTTTGAKGGLVNFTQISSLLGQQELEGKRVPRMSSGKTLPCFPPWDPTARAGGFISDRFLTGLRPQEYYFHCMAGRDGLVDTAVKTSRSGYLQRCLIKNLECLRVHYDYSVRDSDGSIIQFRYGEDGIDVTRTKYLMQFKDLAVNHELVTQRIGVKDPNHSLKNGNESFEVVSESFEAQLKEFLKKLPKRKRAYLHLQSHVDRSEFKKDMKLNYLSSCADPGEPVGVLAAQSIGEPSTQMTLNTFHFAGRGEMNVTLGIPRLREILMTAAKEISTPVMTCPLWTGKTRADAERVAARLCRIRLVDVIDMQEVAVVPLTTQGGQMRKVYKVKLTLHPSERLPPYLQLEMHEYERALEHQFIPLLTREMAKAITVRSGEKSKDAIQVTSLSQLDEGKGNKVDDEDDEPKSRKSKKQSEDEDQGDEDGDDVVAEEDGADAEKRRNQRTDELAYDDEMDEDESDTDNDMPEEDEMPAEEDKTDADDNEGQKETSSRRLSNSTSTNKVVDEESVKTSKHSKTTVDTVGKGQSSFDGSTWEKPFVVKHDTPHILLSEMVERVAKQVTIRSVNKIDQVSIIDYKGDASRPAIQTEGINFEGLWRFVDELDINRLTTNSIASILEVYGVEAARSTIVTEIKNVFSSYGISVDVRHLSLIADFMTHNGGFRPCNRTGIDSSTSPFLKMSFETASKFLVDSTLERQCDHLESPSSRIILGKIVDVGTGCFDLLQNIKV